MSASGSPSSATRSANRPGRSEPTRSSQPISSAAATVAERSAASGDRPRRTGAELDRVQPVREDPAIGAEGDLDPGRTASRKPSRWAWVVVVLLQGLGRPAVPAADLVDPVAVVDVGDQPDPVVDEQLDRPRRRERAVLDRADAGPGDLDPLGAVRVRGDEHARGGGHLDRGPDIVPSARRAGVVPRVSTAPVKITLIRSAPPARAADGGADLGRVA